ncbi:type II secretion system protein GspE [Candidatus Peregrinibacteria bacterium CG_4_10_14_0_2_um_filter_43_11]|nr:MAG: type II secretion system protein GspE [Candidatus Peregrinibacteria bacterium CG_4_10_14_0_2_um_filter_43_11]
MSTAVASSSSGQSAQQSGQIVTQVKPIASSLNDCGQLLQNAIIMGNIPQVVMYAITHALLVGTSDIHIEPEEKTVRIRYRVDGVLQHVIEYPLNIHPAVISRIKIMSNLKIDEQRIPQDGRTQVTTQDNRSIDLRVSSLPTVNGEKIVMRLQDKTKSIPDLPELGIWGSNLEKMEHFTKMPNGIILVTGPTGSGKTNTLYSALARLNQVGVNILTFEDPVEYQMDGLNQSQVKPEIDYDFVRGLRTALRQDPDIIMVGEIRDEETIEIAIRAALTGHLVLSTIHTNNAVSTLIRLADMGVKPYLITSSIRGIIAQRLVRRLRGERKEAYTPDPAIQEEIRKTLEGIPEKYLDPKLLETITLYRSKALEGEPIEAGYTGRTGVFEVMEMNRGLADLILARASEDELMKQSQKDGMFTLKQDGYIKALQGVTSIEEIYRITQ